jgi:hypothetical protein
MDNLDLLVGKNIEWKQLHMWRVRQFTPFARVEAGKVVSTTSGHPYVLMVVEIPRLSGWKAAMAPITHRIDFHNAWTIYDGRDLNEEEEVLVSHCPPKKFALRMMRGILPHLMYQVFSAGYLERISMLGDDPEEIYQASLEAPNHVICPETSR